MNAGGRGHGQEREGRARASPSVPAGFASGDAQR
jgi:hypothetical protein